MIGGLTKMQRKVLIFIEKYCAETGTGPSHQEIANAVGLKSKSGVNRIVCALEQAGVIHRRFNRARAISVVQRFCKNCGAPLP